MSIPHRRYGRAGASRWSTPCWGSRWRGSLPGPESGNTGREGVHDGAVAAFDRGLAGSGLPQPTGQFRQPGGAVLHGEPGHRLAGRADDAHRVVGAGPVDSRRHAAWRRRGQFAGILHDSLLAASPVGRHPLAWCRDAAACPLTERRSEAHSPVDGRRVPGDRRVPQNSCWTSTCRASGAVTRRHLGCISSHSTADKTRVHQ